MVAVVAVVTAGAAWWILQGGGSGSATSTPSTHEPCQAGSKTTTPSIGATTSQTDDWMIAVTGARAERSVPAQDDGSYPAARGEVFVVVAATFQNLHPGTEADVSTSLVRLICADGTELKIAGFDDGRGFCRVCGLDLGTDQRRVRWSFIFRMDRDNVSQPFRFRYGAAPPIAVTISA